MPPPGSPRFRKRWEELYGSDEVSAQKQRANALYEVRGEGLINIKAQPLISNVLARVSALQLASAC